MPTSAQYRQARQLLGWKRSELALAAATTRLMIARLEDGFGVTSQVRANVHAALTAHGVVFTREGDVRRAEPAVAEDESSPLVQASREQVRLARKLLGWSQAQLAAAAGIGKSTLGSLEVGDPVKPATIAAVVAALSAAGIALEANGQVAMRSLAQQS